MSILIIDDTAFMRMTLRNTLEKNGFTVSAEAENGEDGVKKYLSVKPDLVTMDITMPVLDGISALEQIMAQDPGAKVIMVTAMGQKALVIKALQAGAKDFVVKPFQADRIIDAIQKVLG